MPITAYIRDRLYTPIVRLRVTPDEPEGLPPATPAQRPPATARPRPGRARRHSDMTVATVRHLFEQTDLPLKQIVAKTGVSMPSIRFWARDGGWHRPPDAPIATVRVPDWRASRKLRLRKLALRLQAQAERCVRELEASPQTDVEILMQALQVLKLVRLEAM